MHINRELLKQKIPVLSGRALENNKQILEIFALKGPLLKYDVHKQVEGQYSTTSRRIDDLLQRGYLADAGKRITQRGEKETLYGLSWKGLIASSYIEDVRQNILNVIEKNLTTLELEYEKTNFKLSLKYPSIRKVIETIFNKTQIEFLTRALLNGYLSSSAPSLEAISEIADIPGVSKPMWILVILQQSLLYLEYQELGEAKSLLEIIQLLDDSINLQTVTEILPSISDLFKEGLEKQYFLYVHLPKKIGMILQELSPEDKASNKVKELLELEFSLPFVLEVKRMNQARSERIVVDGNGSYLGMEKGCFVLKDKEGNVEKYPLFENEIKEVVLRSGNMVSTGALASLGFWDVDVMITTARGRPVAVMKGLDDDSHVKTRLCQYEALNNGKGIYITKQMVSSKMRGQNILLEKYGLKLHDKEAILSKIDGLDSSNLDDFRKKLNGIEGKFTEHYFKQVFQLIPEELRPDTRKKFKAYDGVNNLFNLGYEVLQWKVHRALLKAKLEPYLGFLHSVQFGKPSLVCDFEELYRYLIDDFIIQYSQGLKPSDFTTKMEIASKNRKGRREYLNDRKTKEMLREIQSYFEEKVEVPVMRHGESQRLETLINEEALLLAKYLRNEIKRWNPRI